MSISCDVRLNDGREITIKRIEPFPGDKEFDFRSADGDFLSGGEENFLIALRNAITAVEKKTSGKVVGIRRNPHDPWTPFGPDTDLLRV